MLNVSAVLLLANPLAHADKPNAKTTPAYLLLNGIARLNAYDNYTLFHDDLSELKRSLFSLTTTEDAMGVCAALKILPPEDLLLFYNELISKKPTLLNCRARLENQLTEYLVLKDQRIRSRLQSLGRKKITECQPRDGQRNTFGPESPYPVSLDIGKALTGNSFSNCKINLTFDDGPHGELTPQFLEALAVENVRVNFFAVGRNVRRWPEIVQAEVAAGHLTGSHSNSHANLPRIPFDSAVDEILLGAEALQTAVGFDLPFFRFPYGATTKPLRQFLAESRRVEFFWNIDTLDWKHRDPEVLLEYVLSEVDKMRRGIILFHDVLPQTLVIMPHFLKILTAANYEAVQVRPEE